ncbi:hypothetical protein WEB32_26440 [Streptomyces netropsis]|uniref:hypothetical protein n=1 Tax=Streptomyces netropsis TaxID=55404 RepID=UPI0030CFA176
MSARVHQVYLRPTDDDDMNAARTAAEWDRVHMAGEGVGRMISAEELIKFRRFVGPGPGQVVIDAGCGKGAFSHQLWRYLRAQRMRGWRRRRSPSSIVGGIRRCATAWAVPLSLLRKSDLAP